MTDIIDLRHYDDLFASRTSAEEWERIAAFRNLPNILHGIARHEGAMQPFFAHNLFLNKVATETYRFQILVFMLYLHTTRDPNDPHSGLTLGNLQKICTQLKLASPGRVYAYLNIMKLAGYVSSERSPLDARIVQLTPTERFMAIVEEWNDNIFDAIYAADPDANLPELRNIYPDLGTHMRTNGAEGLLAGWQPLQPFPEVDHFASCDGGWLMMEYVVARQMGADGIVRKVPVDLQIRRSARRFGGSRTNLLRVLESGFQQGLLDEPPLGGQRVIFSARMTCAFIAFIASFLGNFRGHALTGLERLRAEAGVNPADLRTGMASTGV
jgi:DNA-binding MarR family transcriptional regulator